MTAFIRSRTLKKQPQVHLDLAPKWRRGAIVVYPMNDRSWKNSADAANPLISGATRPPIAARTDGKTTRFSTTSHILTTTKLINHATPFTVFARVRPTSLNTTYARVLETEYSSGFYLGSNTGSQYAFIVNDSTVSHLESCIGGQQVVGKTDFLVGTFDGVNLISLYVNGILQDIDILDSTPTASLLTMAVGRYPFSASNNWVGDIDLVGFYKRCFSKAEIYALYQNPWQLFKTPPQRIYYVAASGIDGTASVTEGNDTCSASGAPVTNGTGAVTEGGDTSAAQGTTTVTGTVSATEGSDTSSGQGTTTVTGTVSVTESADSANANGVSGTSVGGAASITEANDTGQAQGTTTIIGTVARTEGSDTVAAQGSPLIVGTLAVTESADTATGQGSTSITGTLAVTEGSDTSAAQGTTPVSGTVAVIESNDTCTAQGAASVVTGTASITEGNDTSTALGFLTVYGTLNETEGYDTSAAFAVVNSGIISETALTTTATAVIGQIKKPGIPVGTPAWLKTMIEIMTGRRGNRITIPTDPGLTFSSTPTKAECEALYAYNNEVRIAVEQIITRLDS